MSSGDTDNKKQMSPIELSEESVQILGGMISPLVM